MFPNGECVVKRPRHPLALLCAGLGLQWGGGAGGAHLKPGDRQEVRGLRGAGRRDPVRGGAARCPLEAEVAHVSADTFRRRSALGGPASHDLARLNLTAEIMAGKRTVISYSSLRSSACWMSRSGSVERTQACSNGQPRSSHRVAVVPSPAQAARTYPGARAARLSLNQPAPPPGRRSPGHAIPETRLPVTLAP